MSYNSAVRTQLTPAELWISLQTPSGTSESTFRMAMARPPERSLPMLM